MDLKDLARRTIDRFRELEEQLASPLAVADMARYAELTRLHKSLSRACDLSREYLRILADTEEWNLALRDASDPEFQAAAKLELKALDEKVADMGWDLKMHLVPRDPADFRNALLEIRAGTGGDEASIFAGDLFRMYRTYCEGRGWKLNVLSCSEGSLGGFKEIISEVLGEECYGLLKHESGVHRVQRVPETEAQGRIHTSAATVAVMAEAEEIDVEMREADVRIDTYRSSGKGGQGVNTTDSAIRVTHLPTGLVVTCQDERSQLKNKDRALKILRSRLLDQRLLVQEKERAASRKSQVSTGDRSAKIRTYNFPQGRVTDHRIDLTLHNLADVMKGDLSKILDALSLAEMEEKLQELEKGA